ncbi:MAG TPA: molybdate ABC transporter permease subunit [Tepidisphaeraceae bacterium]|jgi:molybdate transport system permease protein
MSGLWSPLLLSLRIAIVATVVAALVAIPLAWVMARKRFVGKSVVEALITLPLVLPPTVIGFLIIMTFGARGWVGHFLNEWFGYSIVFRFEGAVLAAAVVALPLLYMPAKSAFGSIDREFEEIARLFGATTPQVFWHVSLPFARRGIASGLLLAFARALGEFGATLMVFGWQPRRVTLPVLVYAQYEQGELLAASGAVVALSVVSLVLMFAYNRSSLGRLDGSG